MIEDYEETFREMTQESLEYTKELMDRDEVIAEREQYIIELVKEVTFLQQREDLYQLKYDELNTIIQGLCKCL